MDYIHLPRRYFKGGCMNTRFSEYPAVEFALQEPPCLSLYQKTHRHHPDNQQDPIRFRNLVKKLGELLARDYPKREVAPLLEPFNKLAGDHHFWNTTLDGLAVLGAPGTFRVYHLQENVRDFVVVSNSFYTKPLIRVFQVYGRYQVLSLTRNSIRLYEGTRDALDEVELAEGIPHTLEEALREETSEPHLTVASYGKGARGPSMHHGHGGRKTEVDVDAERFFRIIDKGILEHHSRQSGLPLLLVALPENQGLFRQVSQNPFLMPEGIEMNPDALENVKMLEKSWGVVEPQIRAEMEALVDEYGDALAKELGSGDVEEVARAAASGRISALLIDNDVHFPGHIDRNTGEITPDTAGGPENGDLLDDIGELVLQKGGRVHVLHTERMPTRTGIAAIFRF